MRKVLIEHVVEEVHTHRPESWLRFSWIRKIFSVMTATKDSLVEDLLGNLKFKISLLEQSAQK